MGGWVGGRVLNLFFCDRRVAVAAVMVVEGGCSWPQGMVAQIAWQSMDACFRSYISGLHRIEAKKK